MYMIEKLMSPAGAALYSALDKPEDWEVDNGSYNLRHIPTKIEVWIANGAFFLDIKHQKISPFDDGENVLGLIERHFIWRKVKKLLKSSKVNFNTIYANKLKGNT